MLSEEMRSLIHERLMINQITLNEHWFCLKIVHATVKSWKKLWSKLLLESYPNFMQKVNKKISGK